LLADGDVEAVDVLALLVEDRVDRDRGLSGLAIADDQLALPAADRDHRVDRLEARLERLLDGAPIDDPGRVPLDRPELRGSERSLAVDRLTQGVHDPPDQGLAHGNLRDAAGSLDDVPLADGAVLPEEHRAHVVLFEVEDNPDYVARERQELTGHGLLEPVDPGDPVPHLDDPTDLGQVCLGFELLDL